MKEEKNIRLSIIIPFYNVEQYISMCLDSVYQQDIPEEEYEVICVNDASPDGSREIVKEYQKKHKNLILVEHEVNKKLGAARNTGRKIAKGTYIWNVDSDDMVVPNCLNELLTESERDELDVLVFTYRNIIGDRIQDETPESVIPETFCISGKNFIKQYGADYIHVISPVWKQLFRRQYLDENAIYSLEINMSEDVPYTFNAIARANRLRVIEQPYYLYRINPQSIGGQMAKTPSAIAAYESCFLVSRELFRLADEMKKEAVSVGKTIQNVGVWCFYLYRKYYAGMSKEQKERFLQLVRKNFFSNSDVLLHIGRKKCMEYFRFTLCGVVKDSK